MPFNPDDLAAQTVTVEALPPAPSRREPNAYEKLVQSRKAQRTPVFEAEHLKGIKNRLRNAASHLNMGVSIRVTDAKGKVVAEEDALKPTDKIIVHFLGGDKRAYNPKDETEKGNGAAPDKVVNPGAEKVKPSR